MAEYDPASIEPKWQEFWEKQKTFKVDSPGSKKFYCLDFFPYPSGAGIHVGHPLGYIATDILSRYKRMRGYSVLHPMGWDAFGLPAEQHAINTGEHPSETTKKNCQTFKRQMQKIGLSFDWDREFATCDPSYYRWTQWIFLKLFNSWFDENSQRARPIEELIIPESIKSAGPKAVSEYRAHYRLAYYSDAMVNWCPGLGTVLANEEVINGRSERGGFEVFRRPMKQWMFRITKYAERLIKELEDIDWPISIKEQQRNWIGRKEGAEIHFPILGTEKHLTAFTTRPDTLFGVTFFAVSPEHALVPFLTKPDYATRVEAYCSEAQKMSEFTRTIENRRKTGVFTGTFILNPITQEHIPVYVGDYVLMTVGTGAVMGVPAHDERDFEFARAFQIEIRPVLIPETGNKELLQEVVDGEMPWTGSGLMLEMNQAVFRELKLADLSNQVAAERITAWLEQNKSGRKVVTYKLRDWLFSRQRYWGEPIPLIHWEDGTIEAVPESELPVCLPAVKDYKPSEGGESPLAKAAEWVNVQSAQTGLKGRRETNTMPNWAGSCWYYLRFIDPDNSKLPWDLKLEKSWLPVDLYVGGAEHAVLHLLYARFWHKVLFDLGCVSTREPFQKLFNQGMILAYAFKDRRGVLIPVDQVEEHGAGAYKHSKTGEELERVTAKMSKSLKNIFTPDEIIAEYGADTLRMYEMFMGPLDSSRVWDPKAISGNQRFLKRAWTFVTANQDSGIRPVIEPGDESVSLKRAINRLVKKVTEDIEVMAYNTAISAMMEFLNIAGSEPVSKKTLETFTAVLAPFAPHIGEEMWQRLGHANSVSAAPWPDYDESILKTETVSIVIQVNGKKRGLAEVPATITEADLKKSIVDAMAKTGYPVKLSDRFITVYQSGTAVPKLVNVLN